ncbi:MAG: pilus assembly protein [Clostridia bacterium]|nr:pilus assembly protein [Clostridia bacterium]
MLHKDKMGKNAGYMTVEAVLVFGSMLIILFAIIYSLLLLYQNVVLMNAATIGAQSAAYQVASSQKEEVDVNSIIDHELSKGLFSPEDTTKTIEHYGVLQPIVKVTLKYKVVFPMRNIAEMIAGDEVMTFTVSSTARATDRPQYIRNINLIREIGQRAINKISDFGWGIFGNLLK